VELKIHEYVRNGVAEIFLEVEPLSGRRHVDITQQRTRKDWAMFIKGMLDERYAQYLSNRRFGLRLFRKTLTMVHA
jgi:hypothetical protein